VSQRLANASSVPAVRLEWRFHPTYTLELFSEDRFARDAPGFGYYQEALMRRDAQQSPVIYGFFLFREWGY